MQACKLFSNIFKESVYQCHKNEPILSDQNVISLILFKICKKIYNIWKNITQFVLILELQIHLLYKECTSFSIPKFQLYISSLIF